MSSKVRLHVKFIIMYGKGTQQAKGASCIDLYGIVRRFNVLLVYLSSSSLYGRIRSIRGVYELVMYALASNELRQNLISSVYSSSP
jgi:hypothetical protein